MKAKLEVIILLLFISASLSNLAEAVRQGEVLYIDKIVFSASVPKSAVIGKSYELKVFVRNPTPIVMDISVWIKASLQYFIYEPDRIRFDLRPGESRQVRFRLIAHRESSTPLNISLLAQATTPNGEAVTEETIAQILSIKKPFEPELYLLLPVAALIVLSIGYGFARSKKSGKKDKMST